jgi:hypothetical protein
MSDFDNYLLDSDGSNFRFQVHHLIMPSLLKDPEIKAILNSLGFDAAALEAKGNKLGVMFNVDFALQLQEQINPTIAEAFKQAGFGFNVQYTNHPELTDFVADRIREIGKNTNLSAEAKQKAVYAITEFSRDLAYADVEHNGNVVPLIKPQGITSDQFSAEIEAAFETYRVEKGWPKFDQASSNGNNSANPFHNDSFVAQYDISQIDVGTNNNIEYRLELTRELIATSFESGLINQIQFDQSMQKLAKAESYAPNSSSRASHTSGAAISFMYDLSRGFQDPASSNTERTKDMLAETIATTLHLQNDSKSIAEYKAVVLRQMDQLVENAADVERGINAILEQPDIKVGAALRAQITGAVGGVGIGDAFEFLNNAYPLIKHAAKTGDWGPLGAMSLTSGIAAVGWALLAGGSTAIATGINPLLGYYVAAGWGAYGIWDGADNAYKLFNKIADDINYLLGLITFVGPSTYVDHALLEYMLDRLDAPVIDALLVDNMHPQKPGIVYGSDASELIFGRNDAEIHGGGGDDEIQYRDFTGDAKLFGDDGNDLLLLREARYAHVDGGNGNDIIYLDKRGVGGEFFGGAGRDWLFVQAQGADLYGDTVDGLDSEGVKLASGAANADQFGITVTVQLFRITVTVQNYGDSAVI